MSQDQNGNGTPGRDRDPEEIDHVAAEYVLGVLDAEATARCEHLMATDGVFAARVDVWRRWLAEIDQTAQPEAGADELWARIRSGIEALPREQPAPASAATARTGGAGVGTRPVRDLGRGLARLWDSLSVWRGLGLSTTAAAILMAIALVAPTRERTGTPSLVAVLISDTGTRPAALVNAYRDGRAELVPLADVAVPAGRALQVWTLWDRARGPVSVGLIDGMRSIDLAVRGLPAPDADQLFEITLEPAGGSPTGRPTGPILMKGNTVRPL
ncbi:anti-sigma factor [Chelatococcus reniformis]|uniref:Anti-sigma K factor RskA C-terminal domain-containing protein n=1 Tax=Chelatococcus reniformis TaxID=1494448 RepID=A0A916U4W9_9HYPH|nr:anti-sigma factor [Chelatococcus reniformis]GGC60441.1 hypothetical protein GCM10010994_18850 [Chelatococcus reniformis]